MELTIKKFGNKELDLFVDTYIDGKQNVWFKGKNVALALGYENTKDAIIRHVDDEYKTQIKGIVKRYPLKNVQPHTIFISEPGVCSLIFGSKLESAKIFQRWVFSEVLPSTRKYGQYRIFNSPNKLVFKIENETDLHTKVVEYIRRFHPNTLLIAGLGELQDTKGKRIESFKKGYQKGQPDLVINNCHKYYNGLCIEFKTPKQGKAF